MPRYECSLCNFTSKIKSHYERHLNTNKHKKVIIECEKKEDEKRRKKTKKDEKRRILFEGENEEYWATHCIYCNKAVKKKNQSYHFRNTCKLIPETKRVILLQKHNSDKRIKNNKLVIQNNIKNTNNTINNTTNNNLVNSTINNYTTNNKININLNAFGKENIKKITEKEILNILNKAYAGFSLILKKIHFNLKENRNIYQPNLNKPFVKYFNGEDWQSDKFDSISQQLFSKVSRTLEDWLDEHQTKLHERKQDLINKFINDCNGGKTEKKFIEELKMFFMDYSNEIKNNIVEKIKELNLLE